MTPNLLHLSLLQDAKKSLLAFSGGVDSTALFHLLIENHVSFDIAHVNYHTRPSSDAEQNNALALASTYTIRCHIHSCRLEGGNFEARAREVRYAFFAEVMRTYDYDYLLTAHQLNDRLEWFLMQLTRGAGLPEMMGMGSCDQREGITVLRPLLEWDRPRIETYLKEKNIHHFIDESNQDEQYTRNRFRHHFSNPLIAEYATGIGRSFAYLDADKSDLMEPMYFETLKELAYAKNPTTLRSRVYGIDQFFKTQGIVLSQHDKEHLKSGGEHIIARRWVVSMEGVYTFIAPYVNGVRMDKAFKEECRGAKIGVKLRGYVFTTPEVMTLIRRLKGL